MQIRSTFSGSGMMTWSSRVDEMRPCDGEPGHTGESAAFFIGCGADFDRTCQLDPGAANGFRGEERRGEAGLHVTRTTTVNPPVAHNASEWIDRPPIAGGNDVVVTVKVDGGALGASATKADHVETGVRASVLGATFRREHVDLELAGFEALTDDSRAVGVVLARRIHGRHPDQIGREADDLRRCRIHGFEHAIGDTSAIHLLEISPLCGLARRILDSFVSSRTTG